MRDDELERALVDVGRHLAYPQPTRISDLVRARLHEPRPLVWWRRYALAPALVTAGLLLALLRRFAQPESRFASAGSDTSPQNGTRWNTFVYSRELVE